MFDPFASNVGVGHPVLIERPARITAAIKNLLANGSVDDLQTDVGQMLRELMTADERDSCLSMPMKTPPTFDGETCNFCRGQERFRGCPACRGERPQPGSYPVS